LPGAAAYDEARRVWNGSIDRRPPAIVQVSGVSDVIAAVAFAREHDLPVSVKGGGHSAAGSAVSNEALMIDLSGLRGVFVDAANRRARVQGGSTWGIFDRECQVHGLATTGGVVSTTGVGGLTLGGGIGWLMGKHGLTIDNLISAEVVTADAQVLAASESENQDLFWALRGGGGNFGVVTSLEFRLHPVGPMVSGGLAIWPITMARPILDFYLHFTAEAPDELSTSLSFAGSPFGSTPVISLNAVHCGAVEEGQRAVEPVKKFGPPAWDLLRPASYVAQQKMLDIGYPPGACVYWKSTFLTGLPAAAIEKLVELVPTLPTKLSSVIIEHFHGAVKRVAPEATAFWEREAAFNIVIIGAWTDESDETRCIAWARDAYRQLQPFSTGSVYVNYLGIGDEPDRVKVAYGGNYQRLSTIKRRYDPDNLFRSNQNILPSA
jgi:FAD/FMN-containing dehydrogenase